MHYVALGAGQADISQTRSSSLRTRVKDVVTRAAGHLLLFAEALADHLIDGRFHEARADPFPVAVALQAKTTCSAAWRVASDMSLRTRSRRQIRGLIPWTTTRN
jgi:hypothetical protein